MSVLRFCACVMLAMCGCIGLVAFSTTVNAETLDWNYPAANTALIGSSSTTTVNGVSITSSAAVAGSFTATSVQIQPAGSSNGSSVGIVASNMDASNDDLSSSQTLTVRFSEPVYNVSFRVLDIDGGPAFNNASGWNDIVDFNSSAGAPSGVVANAAWVSYNAGTGRASAISNQNAVSGNANQNNGTITVTYPGPITFFTVRHYSGPINNPGVAGDETDPGGQVTYIDDVTFTRSARLSVAKTSQGGTGTFNFSNSNGLTFTAPSTYTYGTTTFAVTTATAGVAVTGPSQILGVVNSNAVITETGPASWVVSTTSAACTDSNSAVSLNPASFNVPVAGNVFTLPAGNVRAGAIMTCSITNVPAAPQLTAAKTASVASVSSAGSTITYTIAVTNSGNTTLNAIAVSDPLGTVTCPSSGTSTITTLASGASQNCTVTYTVPQSVFNTNGGGDGDIDNTATASATYNSNPVSANGSAAVLLTITPGLSITKTPNTAGPVNAGNVIGYTYRVTNTGNVTVNNVNVSDVHNGLGTPPVPGSESLFNDVAPLADSTDAGVNGTWNSLAPGDTVQFTSTYAVVQADIDFRQ
jgi:uncharacterized repeat protein (TIGR01451 family)